MVEGVEVVEEECVLLVSLFVVGMREWRGNGSGVECGWEEWMME